MTKSLKDQFEQMLHITWGEFCKIEKDKATTIDQSVLCSLIRICADTDDISATKLAFDRVEGMLETPIDIKIPKFYIRYTNAKSVAGGKTETKKLTKKAESTYDPATAKLRETLAEMRGLPQDVVRLVRGYKRRIEEGKEPEHDPMVKSVIVANLLRNVKRGRTRAVEVVFDQIDGKLTRTINLFPDGQDVYVDNIIDTVAPAGAIKDENGHYIAEDKSMTLAFVRGFSKSQKGLEMVLEELEDD